MHKKIGNQSALRRAFESVKGLQEIQPYEFTRSDFVRFCEENGVKLKSDAATKKLTALVKSGELECRETIINSRRTIVYREKK